MRSEVLVAGKTEKVITAPLTIAPTVIPILARSSSPGYLTRYDKPSCPWIQANTIPVIDAVSMHPHDNHVALLETLVERVAMCVAGSDR